MQIVRKDFPSILKENEKAYFLLLEGLVNSVDENSQMEIRFGKEHHSFRISPSIPIHINSLVQEINALHNLLNIQVEYGKSLKNSGILSFFIDLTKS